MKIRGDLWLVFPRSSGELCRQTGDFAGGIGMGKPMRCRTHRTQARGIVEQLRRGVGQFLRRQFRLRDEYGRIFRRERLGVTLGRLSKRGIFYLK